MKLRNTLIVVVLFALLAGYVYFVEWGKPPALSLPGGNPTPTVRAQPYVFQLNANNIKSVEVRDLRMPHETKMTRTESGWQVNKPMEKAGNKDMINSALNTLSNLQASRVLTNVTDLAPFGLITPTLELRLIMTDTTQYALTLGDKTPDGSNSYAIYTGGKQVFIISTSVLDSMLAWIANPPYEPPPTPTPTPLPIATPTSEATDPVTGTPAAVPPGIVPTIAIPATATPKP